MTGGQRSGSGFAARAQAWRRRLVRAACIAVLAWLALEAYVRQLAVEGAGRGFTANAVCAGVTRTPALERIPGHEALIERALAKHPRRRLTTPEDVAASPASALASAACPVGTGPFSAPSAPVVSPRANAARAVSMVRFRGGAPSSAARANWRSASTARPRSLSARARSMRSVASRGFSAMAFRKSTRAERASPDASAARPRSAGSTKKPWMAYMASNRKSAPAPHRAMRTIGARRWP